MQEDDINQLIDKYIAGTCTPEEAALVEKAYHRFLSDESAPVPQAIIERQRELIWIKLNRHKRNRWSFTRIAAAILILLMTSVLFSLLRQKNAVETPIEPGKNIATLTLSDGRTIDLSTKQSSVIFGERVAYEDGSAVLDGETIENTFQNELVALSTPKGGTYQVTLSDGTQVWLNADSKLTYPIAFADNERIVFLEGEAFFDVKKHIRNDNTTIPFKVLSNGQEIEVLGTQFNVSAYTNETAVITTLVEGAVQVGLTSSISRHRLKPGQQAVLTNEDFTVKDVDISEFVDWKEGRFTFNKTDLKTAMNKIGRWYDVEIEYQGNLENIFFGGSFSRTNTLNDALDILSSTATMQFKIEGRRVIVMP